MEQEHKTNRRLSEGQPQPHTNPFDTPTGDYGGDVAAQPNHPGSQLQPPHFQQHHYVNGQQGVFGHSPANFADLSSGEKLSVHEEQQARSVFDCDVHLGTMSFFVLGLPAAATGVGLLLTAWLAYFWFSTVSARRTYKSLTLPSLEKQRLLGKQADLRSCHRAIMLLIWISGSLFSLFYMTFVYLAYDSEFSRNFPASLIYISLVLTVTGIVMVGQAVYFSRSQQIFIMAASHA